MNVQEFVDSKVELGCDAHIALHYVFADSIDELIAWAVNKNINKEKIIASIAVLYNLTNDHAAGVVERRI